MKHVLCNILFILVLNISTGLAIPTDNQHTPGAHDSKQPEASLKIDRIPAKMVAPFDLAGRLIVVEAEIEGVRGNFFVDSGAPTFMLNAERFPWLTEHAQPLGHSVHGAGGAMEEIRLVEASGFKWQKAELNSVKALFGDLSHLEKNTGTEIVGVIGADFLQNFTIEFDYVRKELTLFSENPIDSWQTPPDQTIDFKMIGHIPIIEAKIGIHSLRFGIDCGAERAMLFTKWEDPLTSHYEFLRNDVLYGADTHSQMGKVVRLNAFEIGDLRYEDHTFRFNNINSGHEMKIDGLLGYEFLSQYKTAIDFQNRKLYVWDAVDHSSN